MFARRDRGTFRCLKRHAAFSRAYSGVAIGALAVELSMQWHGHTQATATDFPLAFLSIAVFTALAFFVCLRLPADAGSEMANRAPAAKPVAAEAEQDEPRRKAS